MSKYVIIPDVTCDLSPEIRERFGLVDYVRGYVHVDDRQIPTTLDWTNITRDEFYRTLSNKKSTVSSAPASPEEYSQIFKRYAEDGFDIISMSLSSKISRTYDSATSAVERIRADYPDRRIYNVDSLRMSGSFGLLVAYALEMQRSGATADEVVAWLEENRHRVHQMGPIDDLTFIARRGRISHGKAFMGNLVGIKPMGDYNTDGYVTVLSKVKGIGKALDATALYVEKMARNIEDQFIFIMHSDREKHALSLKERIEAKFKTKGVFVSDVYSASGTNIGPGMISLYFLGDPLSPDCTAEKEALTLAISELN